MAEEQTSILDNVKGLDHFDPFQGFVDDEASLNIRYGFRLGNINFLLNEAAMSEIVTKPLIYPIPNTPSWIQGLINLRGILVPVFNIKKCIKQENKDDNKNHLLVIDKGERAFATFIDSLPDSINVDEVELIDTSIPDELPDMLKTHVTTALKINNEVWLELDYDAFIKELTKDYSDNESN